MIPPLDEAALVALSDLNYIEANRELSRRAGGRVIDGDGLAFWVSPDPLPVLANGVARIDRRVPSTVVLEEARRVFAAQGRGFTVILLGAADADLAPPCEAAGLGRFGDSPGMVLERR